MKPAANVLVFSDSKDTKVLYQCLANSGNYIVLVKEKSQTAIRSLVEQKWDVVIIEILHPILSEIEFVEQIHAMIGDLPIIVVSSYFSDTQDIVFGNKIADFLLKPLQLEKLVQSIDKTLNPGMYEQPLKPVVKKQEDFGFGSKKLSVLLEISRSLNSKTNFNDLFNAIISIAAEALNSERATLFIVDKEKGELWSQTGTGIEQTEIKIPIDKGIAGEVAGNGVSQIINDPYSHPKFNKEIDLKTGFTTRSILCVPMKNVKGEVIGVFQILNKRTVSFNGEDEQFLSAMAASTGVAVENALLHERVTKQLEEIKQAYDDIYTAQDQIVKDTKIAVISEISGYIQSELKRLESRVVEIKRLSASNMMLNSCADFILESQSDILSKIIQVIEVMKNNC
jgi:CheY-like chemotaxis protein